MTRAFAFQRACELRLSEQEQSRQRFARTFGRRRAEARVLSIDNWSTNTSNREWR